MINRHCPNALIENGLYIHLRWTYKQNDVDQCHLSMLGQQGPTNDNQQSINYNNNFKVFWYGMDLCVCKLKLI